MKPNETTPNKIGQFLREPVATLPACLCGLDTNPVTSPRMDIHCPKHDTPGGEPELPPACVVDVGTERESMWEVRAYYRTEDEADAAVNRLDSGAYQKRLFSECVDAGWDPQRLNTFAEEIAHLHEELSEAFRAWRRHKDCAIREVNGKPEGVPIEFADALIGMFYNAELHGFDLFAAVEIKHQFNVTRNYVAEGRQLHADARASQSSEPGVKADWLHLKICEAVVLMTQGETHAARHLLRQALVDYADAAQPPPTPADEETAREIVRQWVSDKTVNMLTRFSADDNFVTRPLINSISTALTEARRAGTPTTNAKERAREIVDEWGGDILPVPTKDYDRSRHGLIDRIASALSSTPTDEVAQRARAAALNEAANLMQTTSWLAEIPVKDDEQRLAKLFQKAADAIRALKHFTEQGTCTWRADGFDRQHTDCDNSIMIGREKFREFKFCPFCGKSLAEAVKENDK